MMECPLTAKSPLPDLVTLAQLKDEQDLILNKVHIQNYLHSTISRNITVCVMSALYGHNKNVSNIIQFIEINKYFGAEYFTFYNSTGAGTDVDNILKYYEGLGMIEIIQLPIKNLMYNLHYYGQQFILQDCIYHNVHKSKYIAVIDIDEMIIPHAYRNWHDMIRNIDKTGQKCGMVFRNVFFYGNAKYSSNNTTFDSGILALDWLQRDKVPWSIKLKTKVIYSSKYVNVIAVHNVLRCLGGTQIHTVDPHIALLHHYRQPEYTGPQWGRILDRVLDTTMKQYQQDLVRIISDQEANQTSDHK